MAFSKSLRLIFPLSFDLSLAYSDGRFNLAQAHSFKFSLDRISSALILSLEIISDIRSSKLGNPYTIGALTGQFLPQSKFRFSRMYSQV